METFKIFISHRQIDAEIASELAAPLEWYGAGRLELFLSREVGFGTHWRTSLGEKLAKADMLLLLFTGPSDLSSGWDWMLFEAGFFGSEKKMIALSPPNVEPPAILKNLQHVRATQEQVEFFLADLFGRTRLTGRDEPINFDFAENRSKVSELAGRICALLAPVPVGARMHAISIILKFAESLHEPLIPENVEVETDAISLKMFGLLEREKLSWGQMLRALGGETKWVRELGIAIYAITNGRYANPIKSLVTSAEGHSFLPVVYRDETRCAGLRLFHVLFVPTDVVPVDPNLVFVITAFKTDMEPIYDAVQAATNKFSLTAKRVKDIAGDHRITDKVLELISRAKYIVADLTHERPNVYFELGYARGLRKTVITTVRKGTVVHFDVKDWTYIEYDDSRTLEHQLVQRLKAEEGAQQVS